MPGTDHAATGSNPSLAISNLTVRLLSQYTGRGPTKARTYLNDDLVTIVLQDSLTHAERTLVEKGRSELVLADPPHLPGRHGRRPDRRGAGDPRP